MRLQSSRGYLLFLLALASLAVINSCASMDPAVQQVGAALGASTGLVSQSQANSIVRSAQAIGKTFEDITPEQEYYIGRSVAATVLTRYRPYSMDEANGYINVLGQSLAQASDRPETFGGYHFLIVDSDEVNAFAAPGGLILVTRGMLRLCRDEDQLAAVLAHEIAHVQSRDGLRAIKTGRLTTAFNVLASEGARNLGGGQLAQLTEAFEGSIADISSTLMNNGYSRELERQADQSAMVILGRVGYDPAALTGMLKEMDKQMPRGGAGFAKTHPDPNDRIKEIGAKAGSPSGTKVPAERKNRFQRFASMV